MSQLARLVPISGPGSGTVTSISAGTGITLTPNPITTTGTVALTVPVVIADGGTNATSFTNTDGVVYFDGTRLVDTAVGTAGQVLTSNGVGLAPTFQAAAASGIITLVADNSGTATGSSVTISGGTTGLTTAASGSTMDITGTLIVANGGTGRATLTNHGLLVGAGTAAITQLADATNGQIPIGSTGADPVLGTITAGAGITVTNGAGSITVAGSGGGFTWTDVTGGSATLVAQNGYIADSASLTTFTMPTNNAFGDTIKIVGKGAGGWKIVYGAGQNIIMGSSASTVTTGNIASTNAHDCVELVCTTASVTAPIFTVVNSIGNISIT